ncbi:MAG: hypothetical protein KatS3mg008_0632 [Acidimicrobiales bacterium]|nr:MAG: hypothetical protein KatS3mg008_0632 [Acidimicrobiales bacterium]
MQKNGSARPKAGPPALPPPRLRLAPVTRTHHHRDYSVAGVPRSTCFNVSRQPFRPDGRIRARGDSKNDFLRSTALLGDNEAR